MALNILIATSSLYSTQSTAAVLDTDLNPLPFSSIYKESKDQPDLFFDTETYSAIFEKEDKIKSLIKLGVTQYNNGKKSQGLISLKKAWELGPTIASTGVTLAMHYIKDKQYTLALDVAQKQRIAFPKRPYASIIEGFAYQALDKNNKSKAAFTHALNQQPGNPIALLSLADFALKENKIQQARKLYITALNYNPSNIRALLLLSRIDSVLGNTQEIEELIKKSISVTPESVQSQLSFAKVYQQLKKYPQAITEIKKALDTDPKNESTLFTLAKLLVLNNQLEDARVILQDLAKSHPNRAEPRELEGRIALTQNKANEAVNLFQQALALKNTTSTIMHLAMAQIQSGDTDLGLATLTKQVKKEPKNILLRKLFAEQLRKQGKQNLAIHQYEEIIQQKPKSILVLNNLAWLLLEQGAIDKALVHIKQAHELAPLNSNIMDTLGSIYIKKGLYNEAEKIFKKALITTPNDLTIQFHLSQALVHSKKQQEARKILRKIVNQNTFFTELEKAKQLLKQLESH